MMYMLASGSVIQITTVEQASDTSVKYQHIKFT